MAKQEKVRACAYCNNQGFSVAWWRLGARVTAYSSLFIKGEKVYQCKYCDKPENAPKAPKQ